jgi:deoxyribodipyrimidine photolyase-related protein
LPPAYWGTTSGLRCLDHTVAQVWREGYTHHIPRLMVLANLATLLEVEPRELTDWFWVAFTDAYDWVVEPNVLGMGSFAVGDLLTTKPYVCGAAYIARMSDHCASCRFDPRTNCPITALYWDFLARHQGRLAGNPRIAIPLRAAAKRTKAQRASDAAAAERTRNALAEGRAVEP